MNVFSSLLTTGARFGIKEENFHTDEDLFDVWDEDENDVGTIIQSPWQRSFDELRETMIKVPNWNIYKRIMVNGIGEPLGDRRARITYHYNFFFQFGGEAFDSSYLRRAKMIGYTHDGISLPGTLAALCTMRKGEEAQFVISYELMFGSLGSPPRIPAKADVLMVAQLLNIDEIGDENAIEDLPQEDRKKFPIVEEKGMEVMKKAYDLYKQGRYSHACRNYHSVASSLELCNLANEGEQHRQQIFLIKVYTQLMQTYIKMEDWKKVCAMFNELKTIPTSDFERNFHAQLNHGIALAKLGEFDKALKHLRIAQRICPHNDAVNRELIVVNDIKRKNETEEKIFWRKAMKIGQPVAKETNGQFTEELKKKIDNFLNNNNLDKCPLGGLTKKEIDCVDGMLANRLNCTLTVDTMADGSSVHSIIKKK